MQFHIKNSNSAKSCLNYLKLNEVITWASKKGLRSVPFIQTLKEFLKNKITVGRVQSGNRNHSVL